MIAIVHRRQLAELQAEIDRLRADMWTLTQELAVLEAVCLEQERDLAEAQMLTDHWRRRCAELLKAAS